MKKEPKRPWMKGVQQDYSMFRLEVDICVTHDQDVYSDQRPQEDIDLETMRKMFTYGEQQAVMGLLGETLKREAFFDAI